MEVHLCLCPPQLTDDPVPSVQSASLFPNPPFAEGQIKNKGAVLFPNPPSLEGKLGDKYAVVEVGGAQQIVEEGKDYTCHRLNIPAGSLVKLPRVVALKADGDFSLGEPYLQDVNVEAEILEEYRAPKIIVFKYRPKKHYRKIRGHRQEMTRFKVTKISKE